MDVFVTHHTSDVVDYLNQSPKTLQVIDIETTSLNHYKGEILCVGLGLEDREDVLVWWPSSPSVVQELQLRRAAIHNAHFDATWLRSRGAKLRVVWDTMLMAHLLDENHPVGLKALGQRLLHYPDWTEAGVANLAALPEQQVSEYVAKDVVVTRNLLRYQRKQLCNTKPGENPLRVMQRILLPAIRPLAQMEANRIPVDMDGVRRELERITDELQETDLELAQNTPPREEWPPEFQRSGPKWGTTNWTRWWLFEYHGAACSERGKPSKRWPDGTPSLSSSALSKMTHPAAKVLAKRSTLHKIQTGFLIPLTKRVVDGRVATSFKLHGTKTGRLASASPGEDNPGINAQQIPRDRSIRNLFKDPEHLWIEADYSQLELRVAATLAGEQTMLGLFDRGEDIHTYMAKELAKTDTPTKEQRSLAKGVNFGFLYGMHHNHFANYLQETYGVVISQKDAFQFREQYFARFSGLQPWYQRQRAFAIKHGGVPNAFGRFRHLPEVYAADYWVQEAAFRQAINAPVQSTGSDFMLISLARMARDPRLAKMGAKLITTVHDSVCLTAPAEHATECGELLKTIMEQADDSLPTKFRLKADVTISDCWGGEPFAEL